MLKRIWMWAYLPATYTPVAETTDKGPLATAWAMDGRHSWRVRTYQGQPEIEGTADTLEQAMQDAEDAMKPLLGV